MEEEASNAETKIEPNHTRLFDPSGLLLVGIVGGAGVLLLPHSRILGLPLIVLAAAGLIVSHRHFDPASKGNNGQSE